MNLHGIHCYSVWCLDPVPVAALLWFKTILNHQDFCFQTVLPKCLEFFRSDGLTLKGCWDIFGMTASWIWTAFSSPKNHPIEEENHLNQTSMTLGFLALNFPGCTDSFRTAVILRQKKISGATMENPLSPSQSAPFEDFAWWGYVSSTDRQPPPSVATWNFAAPQDLRREVSQLQREESKQLQAKQLLEKAPKKMSKITRGAGWSCYLYLS